MSTAIFGGTFNPVHMGHVNMVQSAIKQFELNRLVVVPNGNPPHKTDIRITDFSHRYNMLRIAFESVPKVEISDYEASADKHSYSLYTMRHFRKIYGEDTYFIIGADSLLTIHLWHEYQTLIRENRFIVFRRSGDDKLPEVASRYAEIGAEIHFSDMPMFDVSSASLRDMLLKGEECTGLISPGVMDYIRQNSLYGGLK